MSKRNKYHKHKSRGLESRDGGLCQTHWVRLDKPEEDEAETEEEEGE